MVDSTMDVRMELKGKDHRKLRAEGHHLKPVVITGNDGLSSDVLEKIDSELRIHGLIKIKIGKGPLHRKEAAEQLVSATGAAVVQVLGRTILLYRPN